MKDKVTNICGLAIAICGAVKLAESQGVVMPPIVDTIMILTGAIALGIIGWYTGKPTTNQ